MPGKSGNPLGRPKRVDPLSQHLQAFYTKHQQTIDKVGEVALKKAVEEEEPWAIKLCMEYFYPKPGKSVTINKEESKEVNVNLSSFAQALSLEDKQTFLKLWMKSKKGPSAFTPSVESEIITIEGTVQKASLEA